MTLRRRPSRQDELRRLNEDYEALADVSNPDDFKHAGWTQPGTEQHELAVMRDQEEAMKADELKRKEEARKLQRIQAVQGIFEAAARPLLRR
jgi:hypothetical protein